MKLILSDDDRQLLVEGVKWVQVHYDKINYYVHELKRERIDDLARIIAGPGDDLDSQEFLDLSILAFALKMLVDDGLPPSEDALRKMYERLEASRQAQKSTMVRPPMPKP